MFYYTKHGRRKVIHTENCFIAKQFAPEITGSFKCLNDAFSCGYRLCKRCNTIDKLLRKEKESIDDFCIIHRINYEYNGHRIKVMTPYSRWIITIESSGEMHLYHRNVLDLTIDPSDPVPGYHDQLKNFTELMEYFKYFVAHDNALFCKSKSKNTRILPPRKGTKSWQTTHRNNKNWHRRRSVRKTLDTIEALDSNYKVTTAS